MWLESSRAPAPMLLGKAGSGLPVEEGHLQAALERRGRLWLQRVIAPGNRREDSEAANRIRG